MFEIIRCESAVAKDARFSARDPRQQSTKVEKLKNMNTDLDKTSKIIKKVLLSIKYHVFKVGEQSKKNRSVFFRYLIRSRTGPLNELCGSPQCLGATSSFGSVSPPPENWSSVLLLGRQDQIALGQFPHLLALVSGR